MGLVSILVGIFICGFLMSPALRAGQAAQNQPVVSPAPQTEKVQVGQAEQSAARKTPASEGYLDAVQIKSLLHRVWVLEYRINDLLTQVDPEQWKMPGAALKSFNQTLTTLRAQLETLEQWRVQLEERPSSMYLGYMTYTAVDAVLPRLDGVTRGVTQHVNPSLGAQFSQAGDNLFDLQQTLQPHLAYLLRNQDQILLATQDNLAACQNQLSYAMRGKTERATPMKNVPPKFKGWRVRRQAEGAAGQGQAGEKTEKKPTAPQRP
jgi:hypothetical protein